MTQTQQIKHGLEDAISYIADAIEWMFSERVNLLDGLKSRASCRTEPFKWFHWKKHGFRLREKDRGNADFQQSRSRGSIGRPTKMAPGTTL